MARYILRKDGNLYNSDTGREMKRVNLRNTLYYMPCVNGKQRALKADPFMIMTVYDYSEYGITIDKDVNLRDMWNLHVDMVKSSYKDESTWKRLLNKDIQEYKKKWGVKNG
jgi:hypothetical protein